MTSKSLETAAGLRGRGSYALGHSDRELDRLTLQARVLEPFTRRLFLEAGIAPGMGVLDVGCGSGDVSLLLADLVGPAGRVVGVDRAAPAVARARQRTQERGLHNVQFIEQDLQVLAIDERFDAVTGRLVLMYLPDPASALRALTTLMNPGGVMAFQEFDVGAVRALPQMPLLSRVLDWTTRAFAAAGAELRMGMKLHAAFLDAGLPAPEMRIEGLMGGGRRFVGYEMISELTRSLLPLIERAGIASAADVDIDNLASKLRDEALASRSVIVIPEVIGAWARIEEA